MINIGEIIRKVNPKTLWSNVIGECTLEHVDEGGNITVKYKSYIATFSKYGEFMQHSRICNLFPSEKIQDWCKLTWEKGDILTAVNRCVGDTLIFNGWNSDDYTTFNGIYHSCFKGNTFYDEVTGCKTNLYTIAKEKECGQYLSAISRYYNGEFDRTTLKIEKNTEFKDGDILTILAPTDGWIEIYH